MNISRTPHLDVVPPFNSSRPGPDVDFPVTTLPLPEPGGAPVTLPGNPDDITFPVTTLPIPEPGPDAPTFRAGRQPFEAFLSEVSRARESTGRASWLVQHSANPTEVPTAAAEAALLAIDSLNIAFRIEAPKRSHSAAAMARKELQATLTTDDKLIGNISAITPHFNAAVNWMDIASSYATMQFAL